MLVLKHASNDRGSYSLLQFLRAISHSLGAHTAAFDVVLDASDAEDAAATTTTTTGSSTTALNDTQSADTRQVCLITARTGVALVLCTV